MLKSTYTVSAQLPVGWTQHTAPTGSICFLAACQLLTKPGHTYYYHAETKKSTYKRPSAAPVLPLTPPIAPQPTTAAPFAQPLPIPNIPGWGFPTPGLNDAAGFNQWKAQFERKKHHERKRQPPSDRPKSKHAIPGCDPWVLVKTKLGRRFVHNLETKESLWKFPFDVLKGVVEFDIRERKKQERRDRGEPSESESEKPPITNEPAEESEYEEVEETDEEEEAPSKKARTDEDQPLEFNEDDIAYQLAAMDEDYGGKEGEYGDEDKFENEEEGLPLTNEDAAALFRDLLDDYRISPYTPWERVIDEGTIIDDSRYTILPNMKSRREVWSAWSRDRIQMLKERRQKEEKKDPRIKYIGFLQEHATPKLYWPEFKRKFRKEPEMKDSHMHDKDREKLYREHVSRLKLPESTRKSDLSALLKSIPIQYLNQSTTIQSLPPSIVTDLRYISLPIKIRDPLIETYISTLPEAPERVDLTVEEQAELSRKQTARECREKALAERVIRVEEQKRKQEGALRHGRNILEAGEEEIQRAMKVGKEGLKSQLGTDGHQMDQMEERPEK